MLDVLVASRPSHLLHPREVVGSSFLHLAMLGVCVAATRVTVPVITKPVEDTTMVFIPRLAAPAVDRLIARPGLGGRGGGAGAGTHFIISANPPPPWLPGHSGHRCRADRDSAHRPGRA